jgi:hypothetical protein
MALTGLLAACASIPQYDAATDTMLSGLQSEIDAKLVEWVSDVRSSDPAVRAKAAYGANVEFYNKVDADMESLELRMEAVPDASNRNLPQYFINLRQFIDNIKTAQQALGAQSPPALLGPGAVTQTRWQVAAQLAPLITYELTLKGVASPGKASTSSAATTSAKARAQQPGNH